MTTLVFPDEATLQLAITSGAAPESASRAPARAGIAPDGTVAVQPSVRLPRGAVKELEALGVKFVKTAPTPVTLDVACWLQLLPARRSGAPLEYTDKTAVLFDVAENQLADFVTEALRLGNDRQSFRRLAAGKDNRALLRVMGPPYYSLLRALENRNGGAGPRAYIRQGERVWVQVGYTHPLVERIQPAANQMLLIAPPHAWTFLDEAKFRDVYEILEFTLPRGDVAWRDAEAEHTIRVPLTLAAGGPAEAGELWVLSEDGVAQLDALVNGADDQLISRLAFAVGEKDGQQVVVLRARPSKEPAPVLVLRGLACRPYLKLPNLFLPVGRRLHPPLRREAVARLLAPDRSLITWLAPSAENQFTPHQLADDAFRPLSDWVDYVLDHEHQAMEAWVASTRFDFEPFVCHEGERPRSEKGSAKKRPTRERPPATEAKNAEAAASTKLPQREPQAEEIEDRVEETFLAESPAPSQVSKLEQRLRDLEAEFSALDAPPDAPERLPLWRAMARINAALGRRRDATICWSNQLWEDRYPSSKQLEAWLHDEEREGKGAKLSEGALPQLLKKADVRPLDAGALAAFVTAAAHRESPPPELMQHLGDVAAQLERLEANLPVRAAWMAWNSLARLSGGDVLALAKARDRALERLYQAGLRPEFDLPGFLRMAGQPDTERFRIVREHLEDLRKQAQRWLSKAPPAEGETAAYADLMFAFALARVGEATPAVDLLRATQATLQGKDEIHQWLSEAFGHRVRAVAEGRPTTTPLPDELLSQLQAMDAAQSYKIEKIRSESRILEPFERFDPYRRYVGKYGDDLGRRLLRLIDLNDRNQLYAESKKLLRECGGRDNHQQTARVLTVVLQLAPRLGESFARESLALAPAALQSAVDLQEHALLLERGLLLAAHFDQGDYVRAFVTRLHQLLADSDRKNVAGAFESLVTHCFRSLRKLGMREDMDGIFRELTELLRRDAGAGRRSHSSWFTDEAARVEGDLPRSKDLMQIGKVLLQVADGWFYYGQYENAAELLDEVRKALFKGKLAEFPRMKLAASYLGAFTQAPIDYALKGLEEVFAKLPRGESRYMATMTHFGLLELNVIEAAIQSLVGEGFQLNAQGRRWLDEDEYVIRRRIHRDVREAMTREGTH